MTGHILQLRGCTPEPLGNYLKGLGIFRLIAEQADSQARAWWKDGFLWLLTKLSRDDVTSFFLHGIGEKKSPIYSPTPIFAPWGGRSAFLKDGGNPKAIARLKRIQCSESTSPRFNQARRSIHETTTLLGRLGVTTKKGREKSKQRIFNACRNEWSGSAFDWLSACIAIEEFAEYGFLFGTGGNEGSANITNNYWRFVEDAIGLPGSEPLPDSKELLAAALFADPKGPTQFRAIPQEKRSDDDKLETKQTPAGQHFPAATSSENYGQGFYGGSATNAWDVVLMMEGCVLFVGATTKRLSQLGKGKAAFPFMLDMLGVGGTTDSLIDEAKQNQNPLEAKCQAEFWMPLWSIPTEYGDLRNLIIEARLQRPSGKPTEHTLHAKEAVVSLGTARGLTAFHRVGLYRRRGDIYIAASLGYQTRHSSDRHAIRLVDELARFSTEVYRKLRLKDREDRAKARNLPERIIRAREQYHRSLAAILDLETEGEGTSQCIAAVLTAAARIEREVSVLKDREQLLNPCPALAREWMPDDAHDPELRLARAVAGIAAWGEREVQGRKRPVVESLRSNLLPLTRPWNSWEWYDPKSHKGYHDASVWSHGASLSANLSAVLCRRLIDAQRGNGEGLPLWSESGATFAELLAFWSGTINEERLADLIHGLALIDVGSWDQGRIDGRQAHEETPDLRTSAVWFLEDEPRITLNLPRWLREDELRAACELPRVYHLLKLCFVGGRLPPRPVEGEAARRTREELFPPDCLDVLSLLEAGRLAEVAQLVARRMRAKGYPAVIRDVDLAALPMNLDCRRLAAMMLIPVQHPGVCAALAIKPESTT